MVLATDLAAHFGFIEKLRLLKKESSAGPSTPDSRMEISKDDESARGVGKVIVDSKIILKIAIKLSDIGHCAKVSFFRTADAISNYLFVTMHASIFCSPSMFLCEKKYFGISRPNFHVIPDSASTSQVVSPCCRGISYAG